MIIRNVLVIKLCNRLFKTNYVPINTLTSAKVSIRDNDIHNTYVLTGLLKRAYGKEAITTLTTYADFILELKPTEDEVELILNHIVKYNFNLDDIKDILCTHTESDKLFQYRSQRDGYKMIAVSILSTVGTFAFSATVSLGLGAVMIGVLFIDRDFTLPKLRKELLNKIIGREPF